MDDAEVRDETGIEPEEAVPAADLVDDDGRDTEELSALARLRERLIESDPLVAPELVTGATVAELEASFASAKAAAERARDMTLASIAPRVSSGAPGRANAVPATAFEKIRAGLSGRG
jgi:hypothetical protein